MRTMPVAPLCSETRGRLTRARNPMCPARLLTGFPGKFMTRFELENTDSLVIGGGPAGLTAGIYLARYRRKVVVVDSSESRAALIPKTQNYPGFANGIAGQKLLEELAKQASTFGIPILPARTADLRKDEGGCPGDW